MLESLRFMVFLTKPTDYDPVQQADSFPIKSEMT